MPRVRVTYEYPSQRIEHIWQLVVNVASYPDFMDHVVAVNIEDGDSSNRICLWKVLFNGNELEWREENRVDHSQYVMSYHLIEGDLSELRGRTTLEAEGNKALLHYDVYFDLGIPSLADLLNPLGEKEIRKNYSDMAEAIEKQLLRQAI